MRELASALQSVGLRRLLAGSASVTVGLWGFTVLFAIHVYDERGAAAVGIAALVRQLPAGTLTPWIAVFADRRSRRAVLLISVVAQALLIAVVGAAVGAGAPFAATLALAAVMTLATAPMRPAQFALIPQLAATPTQIAAATVVSGTVEYGGFLLGSLLAALLTAVAGIGTALAICAAPLGFGAVCFLGLPREARVDDEDEPASTVAAELGAGLKAVLGHAELRLVCGIRAVDALVIGTVDVVLVACALDLLGTGQSGVGVLNCAWGVGGLLGGWQALSLLRRGRLATGVAIGCAFAGLPLALIVAWAAPFPAVLLLVLVGVGLSVLEAALNTLLQRQASDTVLARVFGVYEALYALGVALGGLAAAVLLATLDVRGALVVTGLTLPLVALVLRARLLRLEAGVAVPERPFVLLRSLDVFAPLPIALVESLATRARLEEVEPREDVVIQGEPGAAFYVIDEGEFDVYVDGALVDARLPGEGFGETALLYDQPRNATVRARMPSRILVLDRHAFMTALGAHERSTRAAWRTADERTAWAAQQLAGQPGEP